MLQSLINTVVIPLAIVHAQERVNVSFADYFFHVFSTGFQTATDPSDPQQFQIACEYFVQSTLYASFLNDLKPMATPELTINIGDQQINANTRRVFEVQDVARLSQITVTPNSSTPISYSIQIVYQLRAPPQTNLRQNPLKSLGGPHSQAQSSSRRKSSSSSSSSSKKSKKKTTKRPSKRPTTRLPTWRPTPTKEKRLCRTDLGCKVKQSGRCALCCCCKCNDRQCRKKRKRNYRCNECCCRRERKLCTTTLSPTRSPTRRLTKGPSGHPTANPSANPTHNPTSHPSETPTSAPTRNPTRNPSDIPTKNPTKNPTQNPVQRPTPRERRMFQTLYNYNLLDLTGVESLLITSIGFCTANGYADNTPLLGVNVTSIFTSSNITTPGFEIRVCNMATVSDCDYASSTVAKDFRPSFSFVMETANLDLSDFAMLVIPLLLSERPTTNNPNNMDTLHVHISMSLMPRTSSQSWLGSPIPNSPKNAHPVASESSSESSRGAVIGLAVVCALLACAVICLAQSNMKLKQEVEDGRARLPLLGGNDNF